MLAREDLRLLQAAEAVTDVIWKLVLGWDPFARDAMGKQLVLAADSIGAGIAVAFGRDQGEEMRAALYQARASLFETKYWLNRAVARELVDDTVLRGYTAQLADLARQLSALLGSTKPQRSNPPLARSIRDPAGDYNRWPDTLFRADELAWLKGNL